MKSWWLWGEARRPSENGSVDVTVFIRADSRPARRNKKFAEKHGLWWNRGPPEPIGMMGTSHRAGLRARRTARYKKGRVSRTDSSPAQQTKRGNYIQWYDSRELWWPCRQPEMLVKRSWVRQVVSVPARRTIKEEQILIYVCLLRSLAAHATSGQLYHRLWGSRRSWAPPDEKKEEKNV